VGRSGRDDEIHGGVRQESGSRAQSRRTGQIKVNDALTGAALVALAAAILWHVQGFPAMPGQRFGPAWFPGLIAAGLGLCGVFLIASGARHGAPWIALPDWMFRRRAAIAVAAVIGGLLFYIVAADALGFHITGVLLLALWMRVLGASKRVADTVALVATVAIHLAFYKALRIPLPWGLLEAYAF
jgi:putative tricarboxylic transport membrane protein